MYTYASALALSGIHPPPHLEAQGIVPIVSGPQAQGDILILPVKAVPDIRWLPVTPGKGVDVVQTLGGNRHVLHRGLRSIGVAWAWSSSDAATQVLGYLKVPCGESALLVHSEEHGVNGIAPGLYSVHRKRRTSGEEVLRTNGELPRRQWSLHGFAPYHQGSRDTSFGSFRSTDELVDD